MHGARWSFEQGFGFAADIDHCESYGVIANADAMVISKEAFDREARQLGPIGSGNHFVEMAGDPRNLSLRNCAIVVPSPLRHLPTHTFGIAWIWASGRKRYG